MNRVDSWQETANNKKMKKKNKFQSQKNGFYFYLFIFFSVCYCFTQFFFQVFYTIAWHVLQTRKISIQSQSHLRNHVQSSKEGKKFFPFLKHKQKKKKNNEMLHENILIMMMMIVIIIFSKCPLIMWLSKSNEQKKK